MYFGNALVSPTSSCVNSSFEITKIPESVSCDSSDCGVCRLRDRILSSVEEEVSLYLKDERDLSSRFLTLEVTSRPGASFEVSYILKRWSMTSSGLGGES